MRRTHIVIIVQIREALMHSLWDRLIPDGAELRLTASKDVTVSAVAQRIEAGEPPESIARLLGLTPRDVIATLAALALGDERSEGPSLVQGSPPRPWLASALSEPSLARLVPASSRPGRLALSAGLLQIHDFWEPSHEAAQQADDLGERASSAYWHGIAHRREPDPGNASYWFRRVGRHPLFPRLTEAVRPLLDEHGDSNLTSRLLGQGGWSPGAMIDLCTQARPGTDQESLARRLQRLELKLLLDYTVSLVMPGT